MRRKRLVAMARSRLREPGTLAALMIGSAAGGFYMHLGMRAVLVVLGWGLSLVACSSHVEFTPRGSGGNGAGGMGGGGAGVGGMGATFCPEACAKPVDGSCFQTEACVAYCEKSASTWAPEVATAFSACAAENPLCFETVQNCILQQLHPAGKKHPVRLEGSGFSEFDGKRIIVWHDPGLNLPFGGDAVISGGQFAFDWTEAVPVSDTGTSLLLLFIDIDGNGACNAAVDITASISPTWNGDYLNPAFKATLTPPLMDPDFVCMFTP